MQTSIARWSIARTYALIFGIAFLGVALTEVLGSTGLQLGGTTILQVTPARQR